MAKGTDEFAGTAIDDVGDGPVVVGASPIDPGTLGGTGGGTGGGNDGEFDPAIHVGRDKRNRDGSYTLKRGRKAGSGTGNSNRSHKATGDLKGAIDTLSRSLLAVHMGIAAATKTPEMSLDKEESDLLANATVNVLEQFDIRPDPKTEAIFGLIVAAGTVYGPRAYSIQARRARERRAKKDAEMKPVMDAGFPLGEMPQN
jgi:hypothetical protein